MSVLEHILNCDVERKALMEEFDQLLSLDDKDFSKEEKEEANKRMETLSLRLESIGSREAESKAI